MDSRLTFRSKQTVTAWQYKIRIDEQEKWEKSGKYKFWEDTDLSLKKSVIKEVPRKVAEKIILTYEWLGDMAITNKYYGIFFGDFVGGVICINTHGVCPGNGRSYGIEDKYFSYLARGACAFWTPKGSASRLLSIACKLEAKRGAKLAIGYADTDAGEYGTVYQASNFICLGRQKTASYQYTKGNKVLDSRTISQSARRYNSTIKKYESFLKSKGWKRQPTNKKYIYVKILTKDKEEIKEIKEKINHRISEYPKREI